MHLNQQIYLILIIFVTKLGNGDSVKPGEQIFKITKDSITKITLTQRGYIQFLRYIEHVPTISDYTFCIWFKSYNLTYSHPLLSYSKHEEERLIRMWISPYGISANLEIQGHKIFEVPLNFKEHQWYHVCQSWSSRQGLSELFLNGELIYRKHTEKLKGLTIKSGGDIVVGQEYTDFDKGLDDGIEGEIYGFNFVLSPTNLNHYVSKKDINQQYIVKKAKVPYRFDTNPKISSLVYNPGHVRITHQRHISDFNRHGPALYGEEKHLPVPKNLRHFRTTRQNGIVGKSLGLWLVELSYNCTIGKGGPLIGKKVLINWSKTTARVFGGAIVKHIKPFCVS